MMRFVLLAFVCVGASVSHAEGMLPGGATIKFNKLLIHEDNSAQLVEPETNPDSIWKYFNYAQCVCSRAALDGPIDGFREGTYGYELVVENYSAQIDEGIEVWTGTDCTNDEERPTSCTKVATTPPISAVAASNGTRVEIPVFRLMTGKPDASTCDEEQGSATTFVLVDSPANNEYDYHETNAIAIDTQPPPLPTDFSVEGGENAIEIKWKAPETTTDVYYYQAMCATLSGEPVKTALAPRYKTGRQLCGITEDPFFTQTTIGENPNPDLDAGATALPDEWLYGNPRYLCGETNVTTATGLRIEGLKNGQPYLIALLVMDKYGNSKGTYFTYPVTPKPAIDFWEDLQDRNSDVEGGLCLLAQTYGDSGPLTEALRSFRDHTLADTMFGRWLVDVYYGTIGTLDLHGSLALRIVVGVLLAPLVVVALLWHLLTLPGLLLLGALAYLVRRRRLRMPPRLAALSSAAALAFVLWPGAAHAQSPYWEENEFNERESDLPPGDPGRVRWHAGIRLGPYVPGIDAQIDMPIGRYDGPYEQMFGGYSVLPMLDLDYILLRGFGQLGVGGSVGYMGKKERAWLFESMKTDAERARSSGDYNRFRMIPTSINAVYRFTWLDDNYGVPLVPYARAGLAYYIWWMTAPSGDFAKACKDPDPEMAPCPTTTTKALGASLGFVGSIGLAIRAERIDEGAARSMRESGIEHAGFYAEYNIGKVDGFGSDKKLSVGDATWFAGFDFEF